MQARRIGEAEAENRLDLAERRPPFEVRMRGKKMTVKRRVLAPCRRVANKLAPACGHLPNPG